MNARGTKIKASVEALKARIQKVLDDETAQCEKEQAEYEKKLAAWAEACVKELSAVTADDLIKRAEDGSTNRYGYNTYPLSKSAPHQPRTVDPNHQRLLNMLELTSDDVIVLSLDSEFRAYL